MLKIIDSSRVIYSFEPQMPYTETVMDGETFKVKTRDCYSGQVTSETQVFSDIDHSMINPATGPIYVECAKPGDLLKIEILKIYTGPLGIAAIVPGEGILGYKVKREQIRIIPNKNGYCHFNGLLLPVKPMIGVIGVAPSDNEGPCPTNTPSKHGGNMDTKDIGEGSALYLPVAQRGALLALGDCHAVMGDGEVCVTGCETEAEVTLRVSTLKDKAAKWPILETEEYTMVIASGDTLEHAIVNAVEQTVLYLQNGLGLSWEDAYMLSSLAVDVRISQVVNPKKTVRACIPKSLLHTSVLLNTLNS